MNVLLLDNYDSFTYNLAQALMCAGASVEVVRSDALTVSDALNSGLTHLVISPGPGRPEGAGIAVPLIRALLAGSARVPLLGVCLGHQALAYALGGEVIRAARLVHGEASPVRHDGEGLYAGLPQGFQAGRYHSLTVDEGSLPASLAPVAHTPDGELMGVRHTSLPAFGVQFHPESMLTPEGERLLKNFLEVA